jgi:hypothetical protein
MVDYSEGVFFICGPHLLSLLGTCLGVVDVPFLRVIETERGLKIVHHRAFGKENSLICNCSSNRERVLTLFTFHAIDRIYVSRAVDFPCPSQPRQLD